MPVKIGKNIPVCAEFLVIKRITVHKNRASDYHFKECATLEVGTTASKLAQVARDD